MEDTVFGKIIRRELPATIVYEDEETLAFLSIDPVNAGHTLVIPKKPVRNVFDMEDEDLCTLIKAVKKVAHAVKEGTGAEGININMNNEPAAGQVVFHAHFHVIPRFSGDGHEHWSHGAYKDGEAAEIAEKIRSAI